MLADKLDNRRVPTLRKFDEESDELLINFFDRFEDYCNRNIKGDQESWTEELGSHLKGETLKIYKCYKDINRGYDELKN